MIEKASLVSRDTTRVDKLSNNDYEALVVRKPSSMMAVEVYDASS